MPLVPVNPSYPKDTTPFLDATPPVAHPVGLRHFHATDPARDDESTTKRQFMVSVFYPGKANKAAPRAHLTDIFAPKIDETLELLAHGSEATVDEKQAAFTRLKSLTLRAGRELEPADGTARPVLIYYPGGGCHRLSNAALCEQLAAAGYMVVTLDGPRDAPAVVFPEGPIVQSVSNSDEDYIWPRVDDVVFLLDHLEALGGLAGTPDMTRIGMFGRSRGGYLSNICAVADARIRAAVNMDGFLWGLWAEDTGLSQFPAEFQTQARAMKTPILRFRGGDKGGEEAAKKRFDAEVQDFGGDFIFVALDGFDHGSFSAPWLNGQAKDFAKSAAAAPDDKGTQLLNTLLTDFFGTYLLAHQPHMALLTNRRPGMIVFSRCKD